MEFKKSISVFGEFLNIDEIFWDLRNMQNVKEIKIGNGSRETSCTNVFDWEPLAVANTDLIRAQVVFSLDIQIGQMRGQMVSCSIVRIPILIGAARWSREIGLCLRRRFTRVRLIEPVVAVQSNVTIAVADLAQWAVGVRAARGGSSAPATKWPGIARREATARWLMTTGTMHAMVWVWRRVASGGKVSTGNREIKRGLMLL
jgi:hypothetical protein